MSLIEQALEKTRLAAQQTRASGFASRAASSALSGAEVAIALARGEPARRVQIDLERLRREGILAPPEAQHRHASQVRAVKSQLLKSVRRDPYEFRRVIMMTSSLPGEGKTFNSVNLALSLAIEKDFHVLLVDGDVAKPNVSRLFGLEDTLGLLDAIHDESLAPESLIVGTDLPRFDLLAAGTQTVDATEGLSSIRMRQIVDTLVAVPNRIVLVDSPPMLLTTEASALAQHAGQIVIVVRANSTPQRAVLDTIARLGERDGVSILLNDVTATRFDNVYYGYGQDYGYGDPANASKASRTAGGNDA